MDIFEAEVARRFVVAVEKIANALELYVSTQTETQNSNLTFEKRTMRDCYNCERYETEDERIECHYEPKDECAKEYEELGLKELKELIEADRKTENSSEKPNNCEYEPTWEQVKEYCNKRCLDIVDSALRKKWYKDEPQTVLEAVLDRQTDEDRRKMAESVRKAIKTEPQTSKGGCTNCADRKTCEDAFTEVSQYCGAYEPKTDQTERKE